MQGMLALNPCCDLARGSITDMSFGILRASRSEPLAGLVSRGGDVECGRPPAAERTIPVALPADLPAIARDSHRVGEFDEALSAEGSLSFMRAPGGENASSPLLTSPSCCSIPAPGSYVDINLCLLGTVGFRLCNNEPSGDEARGSVEPPALLLGRD